MQAREVGDRDVRGCGGVVVGVGADTTITTAKEVRGGGEERAVDGPTACTGVDPSVDLRDAVWVEPAKVPSGRSAMQCVMGKFSWPRRRVRAVYQLSPP